MKAKKNRGSAKGKSSGKRAVKDLTPKNTTEVKGGFVIVKPIDIASPKLFSSAVGK